MAFYIWLFLENMSSKYKFRYILCSRTFFRKLCRLRDEEKYGRGRQATNDNIMRLSFACWITKAKDTHLEQVLILPAFPLQKWLRERPSMLRNTYISCLVCPQLTGCMVIRNGSFCATESCRCLPTF